MFFVSHKARGETQRETQFNSKDRSLYLGGLFLKMLWAWDERINELIRLFLRTLPIFNPNLGIETCRAGLLRNNYEIKISVEL